MEDSTMAGSPGGNGTAALQPLSPGQFNQQRDKESPYFSASARSSHHRDSATIHDKIHQFNSLASVSAVSMSKQLERKTADAALKRAMLGREEAETEMRRHRDEARTLRRQIEEGRDRERRVAERLETVMEQYGRAKEHHAHTQALWEKEIRRARKENFKSQSAIVKLQEELKSTKATTKSAQEALGSEKERSKAREQEAFTARYQLAGVHEKLEKALESIKTVEQERDAFKTLAKNEEVARIAAEGRLPLPPSEQPDDEFDPPKKKSRLSLSTADIVSSAASEAEIEELTRLWQWERQRADRTHDHLEFLKAECELQCCPCTKSRKRKSEGQPPSPRKRRAGSVGIVEPAERVTVGQRPGSSGTSGAAASDTVDHSPIEVVREGVQSEEGTKNEHAKPDQGVRPAEDDKPKEAKPARRSTVFTTEGYFRTLSQHEMEQMEKVDEVSPAPIVPQIPIPESARYTRTPSVDPPSLALMVSERTSLMSLLNAPRQSELHDSLRDIPTTPGDDASQHAASAPSKGSDGAAAPSHHHEPPTAQSDVRPHTSASFYSTRTTTTRVPVRDDKIVVDGKKAFPSLARTPSFDVNNPAMTPTMTREQALAQIRERRGRARSAAQGAATPRKQMVVGALERRDVSAPAGRAARGKS